MKILWHGIPGEYPTGYGTQTKLFTPALRDAGHDVMISSVVNSYFNYTDQNGLPVVANGSSSRMGNAMIKEHVNRLTPDVLITLFDTFVCDPSQYADTPWIAWSVIDSAPLHPKIHRVSGTPKVLWAMSGFGQRTLKEAGFQSDYVPLAFDTKEFRWSDQTAARAILKKAWSRTVPKFLAVIVAANMSNPSRKNFHGAFRAWRQFLDAHKDNNALLYCHTEHGGKMAGGENLALIANMCGLTPKNLMFPDQYLYNQSRLGADYLQTLYSAADVLLCTSMGEGFCLPIIEAQACGCPVIAPKATATQELVDTDTGQLLNQLQPISLQNGPTEWWLCNPWQVVEKLTAFYEVPASVENRKALSTRVTGLYGVDNVMRRYLLPALDKAWATIKKWKPAKKKKGK